MRRNVCANIRSTDGRPGAIVGALPWGIQMLKKLASIGLLFAATIAQAQSVPPKIPPVFVLVEDESPALAACGISNATLKSIAEAHLKELDIPVAQRDDYIQGRAIALYVYAGVTRSTVAKVCAANLRISMFESSYYTSALSPDRRFVEHVFCDAGGLGITSQMFTPDMPPLVRRYIDQCLAKYRKTS